MPPAPLRRPLTICAWLVGGGALLLLSPLALALAGTLAALAGDRRPLAVVRVVIAYLARELVVLSACGALWVGSGLGLWLRREPFTTAHYRLLEWLLGGVLRRALGELSIALEIEPEGEAEAVLAGHTAPVIVLSRHAGPGDSVVLVHSLLARFDRRPRIVMKEALALDPSVDLICHRVPNALIGGGEGAESLGRIGEVAAGLGGRDALLLFPEGGNFSPQRRRRKIAQLVSAGRRRRARQARALDHMTAPRLGGTLAALRANEGAHVIFAAHTGLGSAAFPRELWRDPPFGRTMRVRMWLSAAEERPGGEQERADWLYGWWRRLDEWVAEQGEVI